MSTPTALPPPGWYQDPSGLPATLRWWDGTGWSTQVRPAHVPPGPGWSLGPLSPPTPPAHPSWQPASAGQPSGPLGTEGAPTTTIPARAAWWAVVGFAVGEIIGGLLAAAVGAAVRVPAAHATSSPVVELVGELGLWAGFFGACLLVSHRYGTGSLRRDLGLRFRPVDLAIGLLVAISALVIDVVVGSAFLHTRFHGTNTQILSGQRHSGVGFVVVTLIAAVGAPFFEELLFRGLVRNALRTRIGPVGAVVAQAVLFGLAHYVPGSGWGNVSVMIGIAGVGLVLGVAAERTGRLGPGMVGHGLFNLVVAIITVAT